MSPQLVDYDYWKYIVFYEANCAVLSKANNQNEVEKNNLHVLKIKLII